MDGMNMTDMNGARASEISKMVLIFLIAALFLFAVVTGFALILAYT